MLIAARAPARAEYAGIARFLARQVEKLGVDLRLRVEATAENVLDTAPDVVIIATGSHPHVPALPGLDGKPVVSDRDGLQARVEAGGRRDRPARCGDRVDRVVVVDDVHTQQGLSTAECLLEQGRHVE